MSQMAIILAIRSLSAWVITVWQNIVFVWFSIHMNKKTINHGGKNLGFSDKRTLKTLGFSVVFGYRNNTAKTKQITFI